MNIKTLMNELAPSGFVKAKITRLNFKTGTGYLRTLSTNESISGFDLSMVPNSQRGKLFPGDVVRIEPTGVILVVE